MLNIPKWLMQTIAGLLAILLLIVAISQIFEVRNKYKLVDSSHVINISAEGKVTVKPDLATINVAVQNDGDTAAAAQGANTDSMNAVTKYVKAQGIDEKDIQTSGYNVNPRYDYTNGQSKIVGYTAFQNLTIKVRNLDKVSVLLDGVVKNGANNLNGVMYGFDNPDNYREQAREAALKSAREKAQKLADAAGVHLGKLISFSESNSSGVPIPYAAYGKGGIGGGGGAAPDVQPGVQDIVEQVSVSYEIY